VPLWPKNCRTLKLWLETSAPLPTVLLFPVRAVPVVRDGVNYILQRGGAGRQRRTAPRWPERVTRSVLRHTTAMHLLQSGVDITVIALWLGL